MNKILDISKDIPDPYKNTQVFYKGDASIIKGLFPGNYSNAQATSLCVYREGTDFSLMVSPIDNCGNTYAWTSLDLQSKSIKALFEKITSSENANEIMNSEIIVINQDMVKALKREILTSSLSVIESFIGYQANFTDDATLGKAIDETIEQLSPDVFMKYYDKYVDNEIEKEKDIEYERE